MSNSDTVDWSRSLTAAPREVEDEWGGNLSQETEVLVAAEPTVRIVAPAPQVTYAQQSLQMEEDKVPERRSLTPPRVIRRSNTPPLPPSPPRESRDFRDSKDPRESSEAEPEAEVPRPAAPRRAVRAPIRYTAAEENEDYEIRMEKEALLNEILAFARPPQSFKLTREWSVNEHTLNELQFELDRINSEINANGIVDMAKSGIKFGVSGLEMLLKQQGLDAADGWYNNSCRDMSKYNRPLTRLYKKYWRNSQLSPMMELGYLLGGSLAWTIAENKMGFRKPSTPAPAATEIPRATNFEAPSGRMRPPSSSFAPPKWATTSTEASQSSSQLPAQVPLQAPAQVPLQAPSHAAQAPQPAPSAPSAPSVSEELLGKLSSQNDLMIQLLQGLATSKAPIPSPKSATASPNIRVKGFMPSGRKSTRTPHIVKRTNQEDETLNL